MKTPLLAIKASTTVSVLEAHILGRAASKMDWAKHEQPYDIRFNRDEVLILCRIINSIEFSIRKPIENMGEAGTKQTEPRQ